MVPFVLNSVFSVIWQMNQTQCPWSKSLSQRTFGLSQFSVYHVVCGSHRHRCSAVAARSFSRCHLAGLIVTILLLLVFFLSRDKYYFKIYFHFMCIVLVSMGTHRSQKSVGSSELELPAVVTHPVWVLGTELSFSGIAEHSGLLSRLWALTISLIF